MDGAWNRINFCCLKYMIQLRTHEQPESKAQQKRNSDLMKKAKEDQYNLPMWWNIRETERVQLSDWNIFLPSHFQVLSWAFAVQFPDYQISAIVIAKKKMLYDIEVQKIKKLFTDVSCTKFNMCGTSWYLSTFSRHKLLILELSFQFSHFFLRCYKAFTRVFLHENAAVEVQQRNDIT